MNKEIQGLYQHAGRWLFKHYPPLYYWQANVRNRHWPKSPFTAELKVGSLRYFIEIGARLENSMAQGSTFEREFLEEMIGCIKPTDIVYDIGAAIGTHTIPFAMTAREGRVYSFEPDHEFAQVLEKNLQLNQVDNVTILPTALWSEDTELILHTDGRRGNSPQVTIASEMIKGKFKGHHQIWARSIDSLIANGEIPPPNVVKIDVEGVGVQVLLGMWAIRPKDIFMEIHPQYGENPQEIVGLLTGRGYQLARDFTLRGNEIHSHFSLAGN